MIELPPYFRSLLDRAVQYLFSFAENTAAHLACISGVLLVLMLLVFFIRRQILRHHRNSLRYVIGGWGTRGKSGTERKKAALFHALGYDVVTKVTGSEAMFLHGAPGLDLTDMFIYRANDKASIWEQQKLTGWAARLGAEVFLWECMGLKPDFVKLLQRDWMHDDVSTLTNAVPDHENVQGPSGHDVASVMTEFFPAGGTVFTAEDQMAPLLRLGAARLGTELVEVPWWESERIADDVLRRYPYHVHPKNLALVVAMAARMGIDENLALKEIADWIVPDIGALKTFETVYRRRRMEFANGMSANDRMSSLGNWERLGYDRQDPETSPGEWLVTVVNNRSDRIPRSREFAEIIVRTAHAHRHVIIGSNIHGFLGYAEQSLERWLKTLHLFREREVAPGADGVAAGAAAWQRAWAMLVDLKVEGRSAAAVNAKLAAMLEGLGMAAPQRESCLRVSAEATRSVAGAAAGPTASLTTFLATAATSLSAALAAAGLDDAVLADEIIGQVRTDLARLKDIESFRGHLEEQCRSAGFDRRVAVQLERAWRALVRRIVIASFVPVEDPKISGDELVDFLAEMTPPGFRIRIMGMQNIKGTGLDFAYRWISLDQTQQRIQRLQANDPQVRMEAVAALARHEDYGILDVPLAIAALEDAHRDQRNRVPEMRAAVDRALPRLKAIHSSKRRALSMGGGKRRWLPLQSLVEQLLEYGDSRRRQRKIDRIMRDLFTGRISHAAAKRLIHELVKRQYGGWLGKSRLLP
ncbi:hypothetical protein JW905_07595 [bacterium]|nr:hypothetical protein [candidate division CSSED10-310 bacterium]